MKKALLIGLLLCLFVGLVGGVLHTYRIYMFRHYAPKYEYHLYQLSGHTYLAKCDQISGEVETLALHEIKIKRPVEEGFSSMGYVWRDDSSIDPWMSAIMTGNTSKEHYEYLEKTYRRIPR